MGQSLFLQIKSYQILINTRSDGFIVVIKFDLKPVEFCVDITIVRISPVNPFPA